MGVVTVLLNAYIPNYYPSAGVHVLVYVLICARVGVCINLCMCLQIATLTAKHRELDSVLARLKMTAALTSTRKQNFALMIVQACIQTLYLTVTSSVVSNVYGTFFLIICMH